MLNHKNEYYKKNIISLLLMIVPFTVMAQLHQEPNYGIGHLGILCYVSVDLDNDPVTADGCLKYTIPAPSERMDALIGPVGCYFTNHLGSTVDIYVRRTHLELAMADEPDAQIPLNLFVEKWVDRYGGVYFTPNDEYYQCHYTVFLLINSLNK